MVLLLDGATAASSQETSAAPGVTLAAAVSALMTAESLSEKEALKRVAKSRGIGKSEAYREWQRASSRGR